VQVQSTTILLGTGGDQCSVFALSAAPSTGSPAYVSALVENWTPDTCTGWIESSVNGGAWTNVSPQQVAPASPAPNNPALFKTATSQSALMMHAQFGGLPCTGWLESSSDNGHTWTQVTSTYSLTNAGAQTYAFSPAVADGTGQLVRACAQSTGAKVCSKGW